MKRAGRYSISIIILFVFFITSTFTFAIDNPKKEKNLNYEKIETNLLESIKSDNFGLRVSSAFMLGEIKSEKAIIPLTRMLREADDHRARIVAALSLIKIGTDRSTYVVKQGFRFNEFEKVRNMCQHLYLAHLAQHFKGEKPSQGELFTFLFGNENF